MRTTIGMIILAAGLCGAPAVFATGIPVFDAAGMAQQLQQLAAWADQFKQMEAQYRQMQQQFSSLNGIRNMADIANNPATRNYLPSEYQDLMNSRNWDGGSTSVAALRDAANVIGVADTGLDPNSQIAKAYDAARDQNALNRWLGEQGYQQASQRFTGIQQLLDKVNAAPEQKDILDLQARIQAEQVMMQNETTKMNMVSYLAQTQRDIQQQRAREFAIEASKGEIPRF